jgi:hypothetical protein
VEFTKLLLVERPKGSENRVMSLEYEIRNEICCDLDVVLNYHWAHELPRGLTE